MVRVSDVCVHCGVEEEELCCVVELHLVLVFKGGDMCLPKSAVFQEALS